MTTYYVLYDLDQYGDSYLMQGGIRLRIEMCPMNRDILRVTELTDESLITVGLFATKVEIAMSGLEAISQTPQHHQQGHAIGAATEGHDMQTVAGEKLMLPDEIGNFTPHRVLSL